MTLQVRNRFNKLRTEDFGRNAIGVKDGVTVDVSARYYAGAVWYKYSVRVELYTTHRWSSDKIRKHFHLQKPAEEMFQSLVKEYDLEVTEDR